MDIDDLLPQKPESATALPLPVCNNEQLEIIYKPIQEAILEASKAFETIQNDYLRYKIKLFMCSKTLLDAESAIEKQCRAAIIGNAKAAENVKSGMHYWLQLVLREINRVRENAA